ncbi:hypothetical protein J3458_017975 [Metarhizium acridum]|uniref:uncharacterized protein n=1 Tax=Metarhizium acridum TaxID=92637 RepID=UPI001C6D0487|nr:hypothetical protein J3458_017975 [Metarhizium acridum]
MSALTLLFASLVGVLALFGVALYEHIRSTSLSLPISPALTIITLLLPLAAAANAFSYPRLARSHSRLNLLAQALQVGQAILTTVLATLLFSNILPSAARDCLLSTLWQRFFSSHDARSIRRIQDALNCCGFNTVRDRAWPFPNQHTAQQCAETYGRDTACIQPWRTALQRNAGVSFGIVLFIGIFQIASFFPWPSFTLARRTPLRGLVSYGANTEETERSTERTRLLPAAVGGAGNDNTADEEPEPRPHQTTGNGDNGRGDRPPHVGNPWAVE